MGHKSGNSAQGPDKESLRAGHEPAEASTSIAVYLIGGLVVFMVLGVLICLEVWRKFQASWPQSAAIEVATSLPPEAMSEPPLDPQQPHTLRELRREKQALLTEYEWLDPQLGVARIPIDRAMVIVEERGLPEWERPEEPQDLPLRGNRPAPRSPR